MSKPTAADRLAEIRDKSEYDINLFRKYWEKSGIDGGFWKEYSIATLLDMLDARDKELEQVKDKLIASEAVIQTQIYGKYGIEHYSKITTELTASSIASRSRFISAVSSVVILL